MNNVKEREIEINKTQLTAGTADNVQPCSRPTIPAVSMTNCFLMKVKELGPKNLLC